MIKCNLCPRGCNVNRIDKFGFCGANKKAKIAKVMLHYYEEPIISGTSETKKCGSGAIFFSYCTLKCVYCQNHEISRGEIGKEINANKLAKIFKTLEKLNATNINLVTPTHYTDIIIDALKIYRPKIPIVWNTSGYESVEIIKKLNGYVDIYLTDFKYFSNELATKYSKCTNYFENASTALLEMRKQIPSDIIEDGLMKKGIIVRHLVLPTHADDSKKIFDWIKENIGTDIIISLMSQYTPCEHYKDFPELNNKIKPLEYKIVENHIKKLGFKNGYLQDADSASKEFIPEFKKSSEIKF